MSTISFAKLDEMRAWASAQTMNDDEELNESIRLKIMTALRADPLVRRYFQHLSSVGRNRDPWTAAAEARTVGFLLACAGKEADITPLGFGDGPYLLVGVGFRIATMAVPYLWLNDVSPQIAALPLPRHTITRGLLPYPCCFFSREVAYDVLVAPGTDGPGGIVSGEAETNWLYLEDTSAGGFAIVRDVTGKGGQGKAFVTCGHVSYGQVWPDDFTDATRESVGQILRLLAFINSPYVETTTHRLPRPIRREIERSGIPKAAANEVIVRTVTLRRRAGESAEVGPGDTERLYHHQWWVSSHFRNQYFPSTKSHKLIWIPAYVKGDPAHPFLEKTYVLAR